MAATIEPVEANIDATHRPPPARQPQPAAAPPHRGAVDAALPAADGLGPGPPRVGAPLGAVAVAAWAWPARAAPALDRRTPRGGRRRQESGSF